MNTMAILGEPGTGKTTYARRLIEAHRHPRRRFLIWAPDGGYRGVEVGTADDLRRRGSWPPVAIIDGDPLAMLRLALEIRDVTVLVDECQLVAPATVPRFGSGHPLFNILFRGRHFRVFLICVTQFPWNVSASLRDAWSRIAFFRIGDPTQLQYVIGRCGSRVAGMVQAHTGHDPLLWSSGSGFEGERGESCKSKATFPPRRPGLGS